jgi:predicted flavoprotein YhiN
MAAIAAAERSARVTLLERLDKPGRRLLATGGGRCNLTRMIDVPAFLAAYGRQGRFAQTALANLDPSGLREFMGALGVPTQAEDDGAVYPASHAAADVHAALLKRCKQLGVVTRTSTAAIGLESSVPQDHVASRCTSGPSAVHFFGKFGGHTPEGGHATRVEIVC